MFGDENEAVFDQRLLLAQRLRREAQRRIITENFLVTELGHLYKEKGLEPDVITNIVGLVRDADLDNPLI
jgi:hypothetical protein